MDYLQTTGDRLHDLELDRILSRLRTLEAQTSSSSSTMTQAAITTTVTSTVAGVRSITPGSGTQMSNDIVLAVSGPLTIAQATNTITLTANTLAAGSNITLTTVGTTTTIAASGGGGAAAVNALTINAGGSTISYVTPVALTEIFGTIINRSKYDLTHCTQVRLMLSNPSFSPVVSPTVAAQAFVSGSWVYMDGATGPSLTFGSNFIDSGWVSLSASVIAAGDVQLRFVVLNGNGSATHNYGTIILQVK